MKNAIEEPVLIKRPNERNRQSIQPPTQWARALNIKKENETNRVAAKAIGIPGQSPNVKPLNYTRRPGTNLFSSALHRALQVRATDESVARTVKAEANPKKGGIVANAIMLPTMRYPRKPIDCSLSARRVN
jgi:hypothetical protein